MTRVPRPAIAEFLHPSDGNRPTSAPQSLVEELEMVREPSLIDMGTLSFWTELHGNPPVRYWLSPPAAAQRAPHDYHNGVEKAS